MYAVMITAHEALSIRRRGSSNSGKNEPVRSLGIPTSTSPAGVDTSFGRCRTQRQPVRGVLARRSTDHRGQLGFDQLLQGGQQDVTQPPRQAGVGAGKTRGKIG